MTEEEIEKMYKIIEENKIIIRIPAINQLEELIKLQVKTIDDTGLDNPKEYNDILYEDLQNMIVMWRSLREKASILKQKMMKEQTTTGQDFFQHLKDAFTDKDDEVEEEKKTVQ